MVIRNLSVGFSGLAAVVLGAGLLFVFAAGQSVAARGKVQDYAIVLPRPQPASGPEVLTQTTTSTVIYLPLVFRGFCASTFSFNETLRYNLTKIQAATAWGGQLRAGAEYHCGGGGYRHQPGPPGFAGNRGSGQKFCLRYQQRR
jgi:hypothetical protein